jgi:hypothetical protein
MRNIEYSDWIPYREMNIIQKINIKANSAAAAIKFNEDPRMQAPAMFFALTDFSHSPAMYSTPFHFAKVN